MMAKSESKRSSTACTNRSSVSTRIKILFMNDEAFTS